MPTITRFEEIEAWQTARELTRLIYQMTSCGEFARNFGLRDQIRRASVSVISNVADGYESLTHPLFINYLGRAKASAGEVRSQAYIALDVGYFDESQFKLVSSLAVKCSRQISRFIAYLQSEKGKNVRALER